MTPNLIPKIKVSVWKSTLLQEDKFWFYIIEVLPNRNSTLKSFHVQFELFSEYFNCVILLRRKKNGNKSLSNNHCYLKNTNFSVTQSDLIFTFHSTSLKHWLGHQIVIFYYLIKALRGKWYFDHIMWWIMKLGNNIIRIRSTNDGMEALTQDPMCMYH